MPTCQAVGCSKEGKGRVKDKIVPVSKSPTPTPCLG